MVLLAVLVVTVPLMCLKSEVRLSACVLVYLTHTPSTSDIYCSVRRTCMSAVQWWECTGRPAGERRDDKRESGQD